MDKEKKKFLKRSLGWFSLRVFTLFCDKMPLRWLYGIGAFLGNIAYTLVLPQKRIALEGLSVAFPDISLKKRRRLAREFFIFMIQGSLELFHFLKNPTSIDSIEIEGKEYLDEALSKKKGVIALTAHFGNFPLMSIKLVREGYPVNVVARPMRDEKVGTYLHNIRTEAGVKTIFSYPRKECVNSIIRALRNNEIVMIQMDQNFGTGGVWVKFFGKLAATPVGPIVFALRTQAPVVPMYILRKGIGKHIIKIFPEEKLDFYSDKDETILKNAVKFTRLIEEWIRENPIHWGWIHRRWKSRPSEKVLSAKFKVEKE